MWRYSAYHHLDGAAKYPPLLMTTSTRDDRVHPYHARAFVKRLQETGHGPTTTCAPPAPLPAGGRPPLPRAAPLRC